MKLRSKIGVLSVALTMVASTAIVMSNPSGASSKGASGSLTIVNEDGETWPCSFNPLNPADEIFSVGPVYETLEYIDTLNNAQVTPWLATGSAWSNNDKTLTFTIRSGVKWSDGTPFTAADVLYTFNLMKKYPALDTNAIWSVLANVNQVGANKIVFNFKASALPYFYYIADQTPIVPEHILDKIANPVTWVDPNPIGDGAYLMSQCTPENIKYTANPDYWQPGLPKIETVNYPAFTSNNTANEYLTNGQGQWGGDFFPGMKTDYLDKSSSNHTWLPPYVNVALFPNLKVAPLNTLAVRKAIAYGINRSQVVKVGEYGMEPAANQTGVVTPTFSSWLDTSEVQKADINYNPKKAESILKAAGYKLGSDGVFAKDGKQLSFSVIVLAGYEDWIADLEVIVPQLAKIGIKLTINVISGSDFVSDIDTGKFQLAADAETGGPTPYYELRQLLYSKNSAPIGQVAASNWERFYSTKADALINAYGATGSVTEQHSIMDQLQQIMLSQIPVIPFTEYVDWYEYSTKNITGWPTAKDPYAQPAPYVFPDFGIVLLHLKPKG
jgi:peptide/nickel transport system substrate-binding protein